MKIGLIDVDGHNYPNLPLMKISAYHKQQNDIVTWYNPITSGHMDIVYISKVFSFTPDYPYYIDADKIFKAGTGYCIITINDEEIFIKCKDYILPGQIEHIYPDYSIYPKYSHDKAYGFLTRGCPRKCEFCHVGAKEGYCSHKVADLTEFWQGQKYITLMDPNILACNDAMDLLEQLKDSHAWIDFNQGLDIRMMSEDKANLIKQLKVKTIHFAWDNYDDKQVLPKLKEFRRMVDFNWRNMVVYVLTNFNTTMEQDLDRVYTLLDLGYNPYIMIYNKHNLPRHSRYKDLQRWVNNKIIFNAVDNFNDYMNMRKLS